MHCSSASPTAASSKNSNSILKMKNKLRTKNKYLKRGINSQLKFKRNGLDTRIHWEELNTPIAKNKNLNVSIRIFKN